jgi:hypothetical protein
MVDYLFGGKGATSGPSVDPNTGDLGSDIIDWHPRGSYQTPGTTCTSAAWPVTGGTKKNPVFIDPCSWFVMTELDDATDADNKHHQGIDWQYVGWDRDVMQADVADNGPNLGDRLLDWTGAYNLYTHCSSAYGGYNDVRQFSPDMQSFLQQFRMEHRCRTIIRRRDHVRHIGLRRIGAGLPVGQQCSRHRQRLPVRPRALRQPQRCAITIGLATILRTERRWPGGSPPPSYPSCGCTRHSPPFCLR